MDLDFFVFNFAFERTWSAKYFCNDRRFFEHPHRGGVCSETTHNVDFGQYGCKHVGV